MVAVVLFATLLESIDTKDFIVVSFRPIVFVRNGREGINRFGFLSGEISQHQRQGLKDSNHYSSALSSDTYVHRHMQET